MKVFILLCVIGVALASRECSVNQHYDSCGTACPLTCKNYENPPKACVLMCVPGCHCDAGYVKTSDGKCVRPDECPSETAQECPVNQHYDSCGTACPLTCKNYENPPKVCVLMCVPGCHCDAGYVKTSDGACVRPDECPSLAAPVEKSCVAKPDPGMCYAYIPKWYYDPTTLSCHKFVYGGCQGNGNRYSTKEECEENCRGVVQEGTNPICELPSETGVCRAFFPRYYFDKLTGACQKFVFGGCGGNENNFETEEECRQTCGNSLLPSLERQDCDQGPQPGPCMAIFPRFYYDQSEGMCKKFIYGGCGGNKNNFKTEKECYNKCGALAAPTACQLGKDVGPCRGLFPRYFFNKVTGKCEHFIFGGCQGNSNNFETQEDCEAVCHS